MRYVSTAVCSSTVSGPRLLKIVASPSRARRIACSERATSPAVRMPASATASRTAGRLRTASSTTACCVTSSGSASATFSTARCAARSAASPERCSPLTLVAKAAYSESFGMKSCERSRFESAAFDDLSCCAFACSCSSATCSCFCSSACYSSISAIASVANGVGGILPGQQPRAHS